MSNSSSIKNTKNIKTVREDFPIFKNYPELVYLDNGATAQKPQVVIDALTDFYTKQNANVHRGIHKLSEAATEKYEEARKTVAEFINAEPEEIVFTSGTTDGLNALANSLSISNKLIGPAPKILLSELEHHSNLLPWRRIEDAQINYLLLGENFQLTIPKNNAQKNGDENEHDIVSITHMSNVTGTINPVKEIFSKFPKAIKVIDAAQSIPHMEVDVKALGVDFMVFSGHKVYGPTGVGVLYGKKELLEKLEPLKTGGGMINLVTKEKADWAEVPGKHEAGTPPIAEAIGLASALDYLKGIGMDNIAKHEKNLREYLYKKLSEIEEVEMYHPELSTPAGSLISFNIKGVHAHDVAQVLADKDVAVRAGHHCTQILHRDVLKVQASIRASLAIYNSESDIDKLIRATKDVIYKFNI